jgi:hypothetical protein
MEMPPKDERRWRLSTLLKRAALLLLPVIFLSPIPVTRPKSPSDPLAGCPRVFLWVWERPEDLSFLDPSRHGVVVLARTIAISRRGPTVRPRQQSLKIPERVAAVAVVRIDTPPGEPLRLSEAETRALAAEIALVSGIPALRAIQIDFDARESERPYYGRLLEDLRRRLPASMKLSMTALASWCLFDDDWISGLPVDEAVPMLFRMGPAGEGVARVLEAGGDFRPAVCRHSFGIATDERLPRLPRGRRAYVFSATPWTAESVAAVTKLLEAQQ